MGRVFEAVYQGGDLHPTQPLRLPERSRVRLVIVDDPSTSDVAAMAARSGSFDFLDRPDEDIYTRGDGEPV